MGNQKGLAKSKTVIGALASLAPVVIPAFAGQEVLINEVADVAIQVVAVAFAIWGRYQAGGIKGVI